MKLLCTAFCLSVLAAVPGAAFSQPQQQTRPRLQVPDGFRVTHFADDDVAHDIYSLTFDPNGQVVVSGPGYIRTLIDVDGDGRADQFSTFARAPGTGAMGLCFAGPHLLASGDEGVLLFRDTNRDGRADGPPETILKIRAGGEHHVHGIRRGPDGWWYVIAGNGIDVGPHFAELSTSPVSNPEAGVLLRLKPDLSAGEVVADGFRNAYDFDFGPLGDVFAFDSDGERDVSLPWYRPCRVFHVRPAFHAGWVSRSWKRPDDYPDMQPAVAAVGRGSPTGVVCYRHRKFPSRYDGALFVLDWTFGRILTLTLEPQEGLYQSEAAIFAKGTGNFGFAPTDAAVAPDGSLFVSVGGRGSRGSVYRISYEPQGSPSAATTDAVGGRSGLSAVLQADQPQAAWSRARWVPAAKKLGKQKIAEAAGNELLKPAERIRALEVLTELFDGPDEVTGLQLLEGPDDSVRARAVWAAARSRPAEPSIAIMRAGLMDSSPLVQRVSLEALTCVPRAPHFESLIPSLARAFQSDSYAVRSAASRVVQRLSPQQVQRLTSLLEGRVAGAVALGLGMAERSADVQPETLSIALDALSTPLSEPATHRAALRLLQLSLGDVGPQKDRVAMLDGYRARGDLNAIKGILPKIQRLLESRDPSGDASVNRELVRCLAMVGSDNPHLTDRLLQGITENSSPGSDIHRLAALTSVTSARTPAQTAVTAAALVDLEAKVLRQGRKIDSNWDDRLKELYDLLIRTDPQLPAAIAGQPEFGRPGHVLFVARMSAAQTQVAIDSMVRLAAHVPDYSWTPDAIRLLARSTNPDHRQDLRNLAGNPLLLDAIVPVLARDPRAEDRHHFLEALNSPDHKVVTAAVSALRQLPRSNTAEEQFRLLSAAWRLHNSPQEYRIRETIVRLLQNNLSESFGFEFGTAGHRSQSESLDRWRVFLQQRFPEYRGPYTVSREAQQVLKALDQVNWESGRVESGRQLFVRLSCSRCHSGRKALGPDLRGVTSRFSKRDLFISMVEPNRDIPDRYQMTTIVTSDGRAYSGLVVYESVDGVILRDVNHQTYRIEAEEIEERVRKRVSLMPAGLLKNVDNQELAHLYAFLKSL